jgi:hypothetical protein
MGMSMHVVGIVPPDEKFKQMKAIYDACQAADVTIPDEVWEFFENDAPDDAGVIVPIKEAREEWGDDGRNGYEIDLSKLPKKVTKIRFYCSW